MQDLRVESDATSEPPTDIAQDLRIPLERVRVHRCHRASGAQRHQAHHRIPNVKLATGPIDFVHTLHAPDQKVGTQSTDIPAEDRRRAVGRDEKRQSTDRVRAHKPDPRAYQMAMDAFRLEREEILFAAFAGWDAAGAKWFGYPTFWVNRLGVPAEELGIAPDAMGTNLNELVSYVMAQR